MVKARIRLDPDLAELSASFCQRWTCAGLEALPWLIVPSEHGPFQAARIAYDEHGLRVWHFADELGDLGTIYFAALEAKNRADFWPVVKFLLRHFGAWDCGEPPLPAGNSGGCWNAERLTSMMTAHDFNRPMIERHAKTIIDYRRRWDKARDGLTYARLMLADERHAVAKGAA